MSDGLDVAVSDKKSQPLIFRQFTVCEVVTPSKQGNVSMKEVSFSMFCDNKWISASQHQKDFSFSLNQNVKKSIMGPEKISYKPLTISPSNGIDCDVGKSSNIRSRSKIMPPPKKVKVDDKVDQKVTRERRHTGKRNGQRQKLHWKYVCGISLIPVILLLGISFFYSFKDNNVQNGWNINHLQKILNEKVFGQQEAISTLLNILETTVNKDLEKNKEMPVLLITGPCGVGKSYSASIVASNFPPPGISNLILFPLPPPQHIVEKCSEKGFNLIVLDNVPQHSMNNSIIWVKNFLNEALWQNKPVVVLLIFNIQVWNNQFALDAVDTAQEYLETEGNMVHSILKKHGLETFHISFKSLSEEDVKNCVKTALKRKGMKKDSTSEEYVKMIASGIDHRIEGCKRVWSQTASAVFD